MGLHLRENTAENIIGFPFSIGSEFSRKTTPEHIERPAGRYAHLYPKGTPMCSPCGWAENDCVYETEDKSAKEEPVASGGAYYETGAGTNTAFSTQAERNQALTELLTAIEDASETDINALLDNAYNLYKVLRHAADSNALALHDRLLAWDIDLAARWDEDNADQTEHNTSEKKSNITAIEELIILAGETDPHQRVVNLIKGNSTNDAITLLQKLELQALAFPEQNTKQFLDLLFQISTLLTPEVFKALGPDNKKALQEIIKDWNDKLLEIQTLHDNPEASQRLPAPKPSWA